MFGSFWKTAWRNIVRHPVFALINVLGFALGICFCLVIFVVVRYEFSFDRSHPDGDRIFLVGRTYRSGANNLDSFNAARIMSPVAGAVRGEVSGVEAAAGFFEFDAGHPVKTPDAKSKSGFREITPPANSPWGDVLLADAHYFSIFHYKWLAGNAAALQKPFQVVLSASRAQQIFGDQPYTGMMGRRLILDDTVSLSVAGIVEDWKERSDLVSNVFISLATADRTGLRNRFPMDNWYGKMGAAGMWTFVKLSPGTDPERVRKQIQAVAKANMSPGRKPEMLLLPLRELHFANGYTHDPIRKAHRPTLYGVALLAVFILILAMINFINLSTAQSIRRSREVGVRKVLGSDRAGLTLQFLIETAVVGVFAVVVATVLVPLVLRVFSDYIPEGLRFVPDGSVLLFLLVMIVVTTLLAGFYPARVLSGYRPVISLRGGSEYQGNPAWNLRRGLIIFQFTISLGFIVCTLVVGGQVKYLLHTDYGFRTDAVVTLATPWRDSLSKVQVLQNRLAGLPRIASVVREADPPIGWGQQFSDWAAGPADSLARTEMDYGDESFVPFYGMRIVAGRNLRHTDSLQEILINETAVRYFGFDSPEKALGKFLYANGANNKKIPVPIVGVVADYHTSSFHDPINSVVIGHDPEAETCLGIRLAMAGRGVGEVKKTLDDIRGAFNKVYPGKDFNFRFIDETIQDFYIDEQMMCMLVRSAMFVTIFISCMGLFGVALFSVEKRSREVSIRKVLGASVPQLVVLLCREFIGLVILAMLIATPIAWWYMHRWLEGFVYRISLGLPLFLVAGICGVGIALLTIGFQAVRAARVNPVDGLRSE